MAVKLKGIDVSKHNGTINWSSVKSAGIKFAVVRGGYAISYTDDQAINNIKGVIANGLGLGIYWFSYATSVAGAEAEAQACINLIKGYKSSIKYPVYFDFEYASRDYVENQGVKVTKTLASNMALAFMKKIKAAGFIPGLYTNKDFSTTYFNDEVMNFGELWIAQYSSTNTFGKAHNMWQYSDSGRVSGISGNVDMNWCYKDFGTSSGGGGETTTGDPNVVELQKALNSCYNCGLAIDGSCGPATQAAIQEHYLKRGVVNTHVKWLQRMLNLRGFVVDIDSSFGPATETAVRNYQRAKGLTVDGFAGLGTHKSLIGI